MSKFSILLSVLLTLSAGLAQAKAAESGYQVLRTVSLPGDGGWDFLTVDSDARRVYLTHNNSVQVVDADSLKLIGTVENVPRPHGVVVLPDLGKGYATSGDPGSVVVFDLKTFKRLAEIKTYPDTDVILYDQPTGMILTFDGDSKNATVIDPKTDRLVRTVDLKEAPEVAVSDGKGHLYDNLESSSEIIELDAKTLKVTQRWPLAPGKAPSGLSMDLENARLFSGCRNKTLVIMDSTNGKVVQSLPIGEHVDGTCFDPASGNAFASNGDGTLTVIHEDSPEQFTISQTVTTAPGARTSALDAKTGNLFLTAAKTEEQTPTPKDPKPRRKVLPGTFQLLVVGRQQP